MPIEAARVAAFDAGELDSMLSITDETADNARADGIAVSSPPSTGYGFTILNQTKPPFDDVRVRQALVYAVDRDAVAGAYDKDYAYDVSSFSPMVKDSEWWVAPTEPISYDPDRAKALIADYGQPVEFTLVGPRRQPGDRGHQPGIGEYWNDAGVKAQIEIVPDLGSYVGRVIGGDFDAAGWIGGSFGDPDSMTFTVMHSTGSTNYGKFSDRTWTPPSKRPGPRPTTPSATSSTTRSSRCSGRRFPSSSGPTARSICSPTTTWAATGAAYFPTRTAGFTG
ncbi:MAG: ABC transporter substrate-binding protein [Ilumatobacteraceae bacterium]